MRREKGITLISLVVTTVILIILAGVCIFLLLGENGLINKTLKAKNDTILAEEEEKTRLNELYNSMMVAINDNSEITVSSADLNAFIDNKIKEKIGKSKAMPIGTVVSYMGDKPPAGYLFCDGSVYNISEYPKLADQIKNEFGSYDYYGGDGTTTFAVPNLQGEFLRGYSTASTASKTSGISTATVGKHQAGSIFSMMGVLYDSNGQWVGGYGGGIGANLNRNQDTNIGNSKGFIYTNQGNTYTYINTSSTYVGKATQYTERPTNTSVLYCIKY